jgi:cytochrome c-type biogenesis protein CcmE
MLVLVLTSFRSSVVYSKGVDELLAEADRLRGRSVRVEGMLVKGSLQRRDDPCEYRFLLERNGAQVPVEYPQCSVPDTFRDLPYTDVMVTAEGRLAKNGRFEATQIMAKCPSKYEGGDSAMGEPPQELPGAKAAAN